ncbi:MAG: hypothetical protein IJ859_09115 [Synergistaceae bacterium]|nr:hypothetical protein [Synergistaceae bacterium]
MTKQYNNGKKLNLDFDELDAPKRRFNNDNDGLYRAQEIVSPYQVEDRRREKNFSSPKRKYYKRDKDFTPEERSKILARVSEVGATRAADEFGTRRWVIMQWLDNLEKFGAIDHPKNKNKKYKNKKHGFATQNFEDKRKIQGSTPKLETKKENARVETKIDTQVSDFEDFELNFEEILGQVEQSVKHVPTQEENKNGNSSEEETILKESKDFTLEERKKILDLADKIGMKKAALQAHTKIDALKYWRKMANKSAKIKSKETQPVDVNPLEAENESLKAKVADLKEQIKELTVKIFASMM